jgi:hypothetical protein
MDYKKDLDNAIFSEVHIYIPDNSLITTGNYSVPLGKIQKIEILEKDRAKTTKNHWLNIAGITVAVALSLATNWTVLNHIYN